MRLLFFCIILAAASVRADVVYTNTTGHVVAFTNEQSNFVWTPKAIGISFTSATNGTVTVTRHGGNVLPLASNSFASASVIWIPSAEYHFPTHSSLVVSSSVPGFAVQLHRGAAP